MKCKINTLWFEVLVSSTGHIKVMPIGGCKQLKDSSELCCATCSTIASSACKNLVSSAATIAFAVHQLQCTQYRVFQSKQAADLLQTTILTAEYRQLADCRGDVTRLPRMTLEELACACQARLSRQDCYFTELNVWNQHKLATKSIRDFVTPQSDYHVKERQVAGVYADSLSGSIADSRAKRAYIIKLLNAGALEANEIIESVVTAALTRGYNICRSLNPDISNQGMGKQQDKTTRDMIARTAVDLEIKPNFMVLHELGMNGKIPVKRIGDQLGCPSYSAHSFQTCP